MIVRFMSRSHLSSLYIVALRCDDMAMVVEVAEARSQRDHNILRECRHLEDNDLKLFKREKGMTKTWLERYGPH